MANYIFFLDFYQSRINELRPLDPTDSGSLMLYSSNLLSRKYR